MRMKGGTVGQYEIGQISSISGNTLIIYEALSNTYSQTTNSRCISTDTNCYQVVRIPHYNSVALTGGTLTAPAWDPNTGTGGVLWLESTNSISISGSAVVNMDVKGHKGGSSPAGGSGGSGGNGAVNWQVGSYGSPGTGGLLGEGPGGGEGGFVGGSAGGGGATVNNNRNGGGGAGGSAGGGSGGAYGASSAQGGLGNSG